MKTNAATNATTNNAAEIPAHFLALYPPGAEEQARADYEALRAMPRPVYPSFTEEQVEQMEAIADARFGFND